MLVRPSRLTRSANRQLQCHIGGGFCGLSQGGDLLSLSWANYMQRWWSKLISWEAVIVADVVLGGPRLCGTHWGGRREKPGGLVARVGGAADRWVGLLTPQSRKVCCTMTQAYYGASNATTSCGYEVYIGGPSCPPSIQPPSNVCQHSFSSIECPMQEPPVHRPIVPRVTVHSDILPAIDSDRAVLPLLGASQLST